MCDASMEIIKFEKLIQEFSKLPKAKTKMPTYLEISGQPHFENVCSNILAFYFNTNECHGLKDLVLRSFLESLDEKIEFEDNFETFYFNRSATTSNIAKFKEKMYREIDSQPYATQADLVNVISVREFSFANFLKRMLSLPDDDFWIALSEYDVNNNLSVAALNVHTPLQALKKLENSSANLEDELLRNPIYPVQLKQKLMLKENHYVDIKELNTDFYTNVVNLKIKTGFALSKSNKEEISSILMKRTMMKQFQ